MFFFGQRIFFNNIREIFWVKTESFQISVCVEFIESESESDVTCGQVWWLVTHTRNLCSAFNPSKCTHTAVNTHTHTVNTHPEQWAANGVGAVGVSMPCSRVSPLSWYWGWRERWLFTPPTYNRISNPRPSYYKSDSLSIKPRLPPGVNVGKTSCKTFFETLTWNMKILHLSK